LELLMLLANVIGLEERLGRLGLVGDKSGAANQQSCYPGNRAGFAKLHHGFNLQQVIEGIWGGCRCQPPRYYTSKRTIPSNTESEAKLALQFSGLAGRYANCWRTACW